MTEQKPTAETKSLAAEIAVAIAGVSRDDYPGLVRAIQQVLDTFGVSSRQTRKGINT